MTDEQPGSRIDVTLVAGGMYHDIDYARLELLKLMGEHEEFRVRVQPDYEDTEAIVAGSILVSYTCNIRPTEAAQQAIRTWVEGGGRWIALHGTNSALDIGTPNGVDSPRIFPVWADTLGLAVRGPPADHAVPASSARPTTIGSSPASNRSRPTTSCICANTPTVMHSSRCCTPRGRAMHGASSNTIGPRAPRNTS